MALPRWLIVAPTFLFAFVINPAYFAGCGSDKPTFTFDEQDMVRLVEGLNSAKPIEFSAGGSDYTLRFALAQKSGEDRDDLEARTEQLLSQAAYACGTRTFLQSASACSTESEMPVVGSVILLKKGEQALPANLVVTGTLRVGGYDLTSASLDLQTSVDTISLLSRDGRTFQLTVFDAPNLGDGGGDIQYMRP